MANHNIKLPKVFNENLRKYETTDKGHADVFNAVDEVLINNDVYLKEKLDAVTMTDTEHNINSVIHVTNAQKTAWTNKAEKTLVNKSENGLMASVDKGKLDGISIGAEVNQNAFSNVKVGNVTVGANTKSTQIEITAGDNISLNADNATKKVTIAALIPNSLPANGGNADSVSSKTASGTLSTTEKTNLVTAINECFQFASNGKSSMTTTLNNKGVTCSVDDTFTVLAAKIATQMCKFGGTAIASDVLSGKTFINSTGNLITGNMPNYSAVSGTTTKASTVFMYNTPIWNDVNMLITVPPGYYDGSFSIGAKVVNLLPENIKYGINVSDNSPGNSGLVGTFTSDGNISSADIISGKVGYSKGIRIVGTIPSKAAATITPSTVNQTISAGQYLSGAQTIVGSANLIAANIKNGVNIFGVTGAAPIPSGTATAAQVLTGYSFSNGSSTGISGSMVNHGNVSSTLTTQGSSYTISAGYHAGGGKVNANISNLIAGNIKKGVNVGGVVGTLNAPVTKKETITVDVPVNLTATGTSTPRTVNISLKNVNIIGDKYFTIEDFEMNYLTTSTGGAMALTAYNIYISMDDVDRQNGNIKCTYRISSSGSYKINMKFVLLYPSNSGLWSSKGTYGGTIA